jgi:high-affinity K+ transport system ATPase subunit B
MRDLNWRAAFKRAAVFIGIYALILYVMSVAFPENFGITEEQLPAIAINAVLFFFVFAFFFAFTQRRRERRIAELRARRKKDRPEKDAGDGEEPTGSSLKGRQNPNTSRRKARRRR